MTSLYPLSMHPTDSVGHQAVPTLSPRQQNLAPPPINTNNILRYMDNGIGSNRGQVWTVYNNRKNLEEKIDALLLDREQQKNVYANQEEDFTYVGNNEFGKANGLNLFELEMFMRFLVLTDKIYAFAPAKLGHYLIKKPGVDLNKPLEVWTKERLIELDNYLKTLTIPEGSSDFSDEEWEFYHAASDRIMEANYQRIAYYGLGAIELPMPYEGTKYDRVMAFFLRHRVISVWNVAEGSNKIFAKIYHSDYSSEIGTGQGGWKWEQWKKEE